MGKSASTVSCGSAARCPSGRPACAVECPEWDRTDAVHVCWSESVKIKCRYLRKGNLYNTPVKGTASRLRLLYFLKEFPNVGCYK